MPTLSAQLAYLFYLSDQATGQDIREWTVDYLVKEVIGWAQHVDILWPTLPDDDKKAVLNEAEHIYTKETRRYGQNIIKEQLVSKQWNNCLSAILLHTVANKDVPEKVFVEAIQRYAKSIDSNRLEANKTGFPVNLCMEASVSVSNLLQPGQYCEKINKVSNVLLNRLAGHCLSESGENDLFIRYITKKENESCIAVGLSLLSLCNDALVDPSIIRDIINKMFDAGEETKKVFFRNCLLFVCISKLFLEPPCLTKERYASAQQMICELFYSLFNVKMHAAHSFELLISYHSYSLTLLLCRLLNNSGEFAHAYLSQLLVINEKSQMAMLNDYMDWRIDDAEIWGSDSLIIGLVEKWQHLSVLYDQKGQTTECLQKDKIRFDMLKVRLGKELDSPGVIAIVNFWDAFYEQFKTK